MSEFDWFRAERIAEGKEENRVHAGRVLRLVCGPRRNQKP